MFNLQRRLSRPSNLVKRRHRPFLPSRFPPTSCQRQHQRCFFLFKGPADTNLKSRLPFPPFLFANLSQGLAHKPALMNDGTFKFPVSKCSQPGDVTLGAGLVSFAAAAAAALHLHLDKTQSSSPNTCCLHRKSRTTTDYSKWSHHPLSYVL